MLSHWTVVLEPEPEGGYTASIAEFPGAISYGETEEEAKEMVLEALEELIESYREIRLSERSKESVLIAA